MAARDGVETPPPDFSRVAALQESWSDDRSEAGYETAKLAEEY
jgi:hypothetical protein